MTPDEFTIQETFVNVGQGHKLYVQEWGNPKAKLPILALHGGPGGGFKNSYKERYDPSQQRVIFFDQRGCGNSLPKGSLEHNTTADLIEDIEKIAARLKLDKFILTGGSWGSCLALAYAIKYPARISAMALQGIFTGSQREIDWLNQGRFTAFFPDVWQKYLQKTPEKYHQSPSEYHYARILGDNENAALESARAYSEVEGALLRLDDRFTPRDDDSFDLDSPRMEVHYLANGCFMPERYILDNAAKLTMPVWLVQGRYDFVCPPETAYELHQALPDSQLIWTMAGHSNDRSNYEVMRTILLQLSRG